MAFRLSRESKHQVIAQERLYLTADQSRVVAEGDANAAFLLAAVGQPIAIHVAEKFGLVEGEKAAEQEGQKTGSEPVRRTNRRGTPEATR